MNDSAPQSKPAGEYAKQGFFGGCGCLGLVLVIVFAPVLIIIAIGGVATLTVVLEKTWWILLIAAAIGGGVWWLAKRVREKREQEMSFTYPVRCSQCGTVNDPTAVYCSQCAAELKRPTT